MVVGQHALEQPFGVRVQNGLEFDTAGAELGSLHTRRLSLFGTLLQRRLKHRLTMQQRFPMKRPQVSYTRR